MARRPAPSLALRVLAGAALLATACAHTSDREGATTVTSADPSRAPLTAATRSDREVAAMRLADELCARAAACGEVRPGARYPTEEACMMEQGNRAPARMAEWTCAPTPTQAGFEECLAAIRSERCETDLAQLERLVVCRGARVCGS